MISLACIVVFNLVGYLEVALGRVSEIVGEHQHEKPLSRANKDARETKWEERQELE